jgi:5-methylcytosine-specific restriction protein A
MAWQAKTPNRMATRAWRKLRALVLAEQPFCQLCEAAGVVTYASRSVVVDHIKPLSEGGSNDRDNLQGLCQYHSDLKTAQEAARAQGRAEPTSIRVKPTFDVSGWPIQ